MCATIHDCGIAMIRQRRWKSTTKKRRTRKKNRMNLRVLSPCPLCSLFVSFVSSWLISRLSSTEDVFDLAPDASRRSLIEFFFDDGELFEQSFLFAGQSSRSDDGSDHEQIAAPMAL